MATQQHWPAGLIGYRLRSLIIFILLSAAYGAYAESDLDQSEQQEAVKRLAELLDENHAFRGEFVQRVLEQDGYESERLQGVMQFESPNRLYWRTGEPFSTLLVADGERLVYYDPDLEQASIRVWQEDPTLNPMAAFAIGNRLQDYFEVVERWREPSTDKVAGETTAASGYQDHFKLRPITRDRVVEELTLSFAANVEQETLQSPSPLSRLTFVDQLGQVTELTFLAKRDVVIPEAPYTFQIPEGTEIILYD